jgi:V/A-type H+-transporting ATPase subunit D
MHRVSNRRSLLWVNGRTGKETDGRLAGGEPVSTVIATRSELLARRSREGIARRGHALLTQKRAALIAELRRVGREVGDKRAELERIAAAARRALAQATALDGPQAVASAAVAAAGEVSARLTTRSVAGVRVIELSADRVARARTERGYALTTSTALTDQAAASFEAELDALLDLVAAELNLRRLTAEVARATRQVNALEQVVIPRLAAEQRHIAATLEQRALEDRVRISRRATAGAGP